MTSIRGQQGNAKAEEQIAKRTFIEWRSNDLCAVPEIENAEEA